MTPLDILTTARALVARGHATKAPARTSTGRAVVGTDHQAVSWSIGGAMAVACGDETRLGLQAFGLIRVECMKLEVWGGDVASTQDRLDQAGALAVIDAAIAAARAPVKKTKNGRAA